MQLTLTKRAGPKNKWFFFSCFEWMTLKSRLIPDWPVAVAHLSSLSSSSVRSAMEPFNSVITVPGARGRVARMQSSDFPVA